MCGQVVINIGGFRVTPCASAVSIFLGPLRGGQTITIGSGADSETAVIDSINWWGSATITLTAPLSHAHVAGAQVSGSGIALHCIDQDACQGDPGQRQPSFTGRT